MPIVTKDVLHAGNYMPRDGKGGRKRVSISPRMVAHLQQRLADMAKANVLPPLVWEHQKTLKPQTSEERDRAKAERVRDLMLGHAVGSQLDKGGDFFSAKLDIPDPANVKRFETAKFVSPMIEENFVDGTGKLWPGPSITHIAVTGWPVQHNQKPFSSMTPPEVALSLAPQANKRACVWLSLGSIIGEYDMADDADADIDSGKPPDAVTAEADEEAEEEEGVDTSKANTDNLDHLDQQGWLEKAVECLQEKGINLGEGVTLDNVFERITVACANKTDANEMPPTGPPPGAMPGDVSGAAPPPAPANPTVLSLEVREKNAQAATARLVNAERNSLKRRVRALFGFLTKPEIEELDKEIDKVALSFGDDGAVVQVPLIARIEAHERDAKRSSNSFFRPPGQFGLDADGSDIREVPNPDAPAGAENDQQTVKEIAEHNWGIRRRRA